MDDVAASWVRFFTFSSVNVAYVAIGCVLLGAAAGMVGCFAFLRKRSLLGDALAHAALPGICVAFLLTGSKDPVVILLGAVASCWIGALTVDWITRCTRCKEDSALGIVLSVFFGVGILVLTHIQHSGNAAQAGLDRFLFGQAAGLVARDVKILAGTAVLLCCVVALLYKEFKVILFDPDFARAAGLPVRRLEIALATVIVLAVGIGLQAVGVVLMAAMLVTPAAAARYWTDRLSAMLALAAVLGGVSGALGAWASYVAARMPTGPWMVVCVTGLFFASFLLAPGRGLAARLLRLRRFRRKTAVENLLRTLYQFGEAGQDWNTPRSLPELLERRGASTRELRRTLARLGRAGLVSEAAPGMFTLTADGAARGARVTRVHRLWEVYLTRKLEIAPDRVHDDAEEIEHVLTPELERRLAETLEYPERDPHGSRIPRAGRISISQGT
ncbi:MAG TPA: iron chelate uptake ABC transporter family permease subunit [Candidatus Hydrogenedentes bacterium]|nr:iron chelate uptake ABC transporter family permease subunit [Candidatus Hydrogenedentota bacterium]